MAAVFFGAVIFECDFAFLSLGKNMTDAKFMPLGNSEGNEGRGRGDKEKP